MSFPIFPYFRKLVPQDRAAYLAFFERVDPYSDFSFNNLMIWLDLHDDLEISRYRTCLVLRFTNPFVHGTKHRAYTILGDRHCLAAIDAIFTLQESLGEPPQLTMAPECAVSDMLQSSQLPGNLVIRASNDHRDYIFETADVVALQGQRLLNLRRNLSVFRREHPENVTMERYDLSNTGDQIRITNALSTWQQNSSFNKNDPHFDETKALQRYFRFNDYCPAECRCFFLNGRMFGFSIVHYPPQRGWAVFNHLRATRDVPHGYDYIYYATMAELYHSSITQVNFEQDLGIPGLRTHKKQLGRSSFLYRYDISRY